jgi:hypothetical protein
MYSEGPNTTSITSIVAARSPDGSSFVRSVVATSPRFIDFEYPCPSATSDRFYVTHGGAAGVQLRWSDDNGATWPAANVTAVFTDALVFGDPKCATAGDEVWVVDGTHTLPFGMTAESFPPLDGIRVAHSPDRGQTIDRVAQAADSAAAMLFQRPVLVAEPSGALDLMYYAGQSDGDANGTYRWSRSSDHGATFAPSVVVHGPVDFLTSRASTQWIGDYTGIAWSQGAIFTTYADNSSPSAHIAFYRAPAGM